MKREAREFKFGYPHFADGVPYAWPDDSKDYDALFLEKRDALMPFLLDKLRGYMKDFKLFSWGKGYPHASKGVNGLEFHIGTGGRWIEAWKMLGGYFINPHNLDGWGERACYFNLGSDILEFVDETILAPRLTVEGSSFRLQYPVPRSKSLPDIKTIDREQVSRIFSVAKLSSDFQILPNYNIESPEVQLSLGRRTCEARSSSGWNIAKASFLVVHLMNLY